jgi:hypothetical protein
MKGTAKEKMERKENNLDYYHYHYQYINTVIDMKSVIQVV